MAQIEMKTKWMPYIGFSKVEPTRHFTLGVWNHPKTYYNKWEALPVEEFQLYKTDSKELPNPKKLDFMVKLGMYRWINQNGRIYLGLNLYNIMLETSELHRLRLSDQIDEERGFVTASEIYSGIMQTTFNNLSIESSYFVQQNFKKHNLAHRMGIGLNLNIVLRSTYHIFANPYGNHSIHTEYYKYYSNSDLNIRDKAWSFFPRFYYEFRVWKLERGDLWLTTSYGEGIALIPNKKRQNKLKSSSSSISNNTTGTMNFGVKFDFNRK